MRIVLIQACNLVDATTGEPWAKRNRRYAYASTTLTTLASLVPAELRADVTIYDEGVQLLPERLEADLVGISAMTANASRAYALADALRARGITVVLGGFHPSAVPMEALEHADAVVVGFAEESWPRLLRDLSRGELQSLYHERANDVFQRSFPVPRRELLRRGSYLLRGTIEASRGCRNRCEFCVIPRSAQGRFLKRPVEQVVAEMKTLKSRWITLLDSSPTEDLPYTLALYEAMRPLRTKWLGATTLKAVANDRWLEAARASGCRGVLIGFESVNQGALQRAHKGFNRVEQYVEMVRRLHDHGIMVLGCFVFGLDGDDATVFANTVDFVNQAGVDICQYTVFTPFPGTPSYDRLTKEGRILHRDWRFYDGKHVVFEPLQMSREGLLDGLCWAWKKTYSGGSIMRRLWRSRSYWYLALIGNLVFRRYGRSFIPPHFDLQAAESQFRRSLAVGSAAAMAETCKETTLRDRSGPPRAAA